MCIIGHVSGYRPDYPRLPELFEVPAATVDKLLATVPEFAEARGRAGGCATSAESAGSAETSKSPAEYASERLSDFSAGTCPNLPNPSLAMGPAKIPKRAKTRKTPQNGQRTRPAVLANKWQKWPESPPTNPPALLSNNSDVSHAVMCPLGQRPVAATQPLVASHELHESLGHAVSGFPGISRRAPPARRADRHRPPGGAPSRGRQGAAAECAIGTGLLVSQQRHALSPGRRRL